MKEKTNRRWGLMLLSVLSAFLVWLGVVNVADPITTNTVEVPVEIINDEILTANGLTYEIVGKRTTTISYEVKTTNAYRIRPGDFRAYADMTEMWDVTGSIPIKVEISNHEEFLESNPVSKSATIKIKTERMQEKPFVIDWRFTGEMEEGYEPGEVTLSPGQLSVKGPESLIGQISSVGIEIPVDGLTAETEGTARILYYDANGNQIALSERITSDCEEAGYRLSVLKGKTLNLDFRVSGEVAEGYRFTGVECDVRSVSVVGLRSALASLHTITISEESLNLNGASTNVVKTIDLTDCLPEGISLADSAPREIRVTLTVERLEERIFAVEVGSGNLVGASDAYEYQLSNNRVEIRLRALREELDGLNLDGLAVKIDVSGLSEGEHAANVTVSLDPAYEVVSIAPCTVHVIREPESVSHGTDPGHETNGYGEVEETGQEPGEAIPADARVSETSKGEPEETDDSLEQTKESGQEEST
ncbi:MAG: hypothetical protein HFE83_03435 [Lachnospiraceae bacterium]|nr:hypothetical protein [Lachnospiraceae bacterium]